MQMHPARLVIFEKKGKWAVGLRRELREDPPPLCEVRSRRDCLDELQRSPASFLGIETTLENVEQVYRLLVYVHRMFPAARCAVLGQPDTQPLESALLEAGAVYAIFNTRQLPTIATLARRHLSLSAGRKLTWRQAVTARLPWAD